MIPGSKVIFFWGGGGGEGGGGQSRDQGPDSRVYSPGSRVHYSFICCRNCDRKILESCLLECQKVAKKLPKIQKVVT